MNSSTRLLRCICDETRFEMLGMLLEHKSLCVGDFVGAMDRDQPLISHHLRQLRECGIVSSRQDGKKTMYMIANTMLAELISGIMDAGRKMPDLCAVLDDDDNNNDDTSSPVRNSCNCGVLTTHNVV